MAKKKKKRSTSDASLRREVEALKAQLKEHGIAPQPTKVQDKTAGIDYNEIKKTENKDTKKKKVKVEEDVSSDTSYLKKDVIKTILISSIIISAIVVIKLLNLF